MANCVGVITQPSEDVVRVSIFFRCVAAFVYSLHGIFSIQMEGEYSAEACVDGVFFTSNAFVPELNE